jgi:serine/threonine protein kinase
MPQPDSSGIDTTAPPFHHFRSIQRLAPARRGQTSGEHSRHQLYVGRDKRTSTGVLFKLTSKPGRTYEHDLANEAASLSTVNRELPDSPYFPFVHDHGRLGDGRMYLITSLFDELPLATAIGTGRTPGKLVAHLRTAMEVAKALEELHGLPIVHVDLNPMNILQRVEKDRPLVRVVDFESSYEPARHSKGVFYSPPTTPLYSAPEVSHQTPDARADLFSLGAVLYTLLAGYQWTWEAEVGTCIERDEELDSDLKEILLTAVAQNPDRRYPSVHEFHAALAGYLERIWPGRSW